MKIKKNKKAKSNKNKIKSFNKRRTIDSIKKVKIRILSK